jgi:uncharacterized protein YdhG (YjbR/CyaY superfamily)
MPTRHVSRSQNSTQKGFKTVDEYIASHPKKVQNILQELRQTVKEVAPEAKEVISYQMPAFKQNGVLVWFAAFKSHVGFFPKVSAIEAFKQELSGYELSKGTIRFPLDKPMPLELIKKIVRYRLEEDSKLKKRTKKESAM